jgi:hypothetical protein
MISATITWRKMMDTQIERVRDLIGRMKPSVRSPGINRRLSRPGYKPWEDQWTSEINRAAEERSRARMMAYEARIEELEAIVAENVRVIEGLKKYQKPSNPQP